MTGPALERASTNSAAFTAATKVVWSFDPTATLTTSLAETSSETADWPADAGSVPAELLA